MTSRFAIVTLDIYADERAQTTKERSQHPHHRVVSSDVRHRFVIAAAVGG